MPDLDVKTLSEKQKQHRFILPLGKYRIVKIEKGFAYFAMGGTTTMAFSIPPFADVRVGDVHTFYTEVLAKDALTSKPPLK